MTAIPFSTQTHGGMGNANGLLRLDGRELVLEFQVKVLGMIRMEPKEIRVPLDQIVSMTLHEGWFSTTLRIQANSLVAWKGFPESDMGRVVLSLTREERDAARDLIGTALPTKPVFDPDFA